MWVVLLIVFIGFLHGEDFLKGVTAKDLAIAKEEKPTPEDTLGSSDVFFFYFNTNSAMKVGHPSGKFRIEGKEGATYLVNLETKREIRLDERCFDLQWSPCGKYLTYTKPEILPEIDPETGRNRLGKYELWIWDTESEKRRKLSGEFDVVAYMWSSDSKFIVFEGTKYGPMVECKVYLLSMEVESGKLFLIDSFPCSWEDDFCFSISPDGRMVIYSKPLEADHLGPTHSELFVADIDGSYKKQLTNTPDRLEWLVKWLPDGRSVLLKWIDLREGGRKVSKLILKRVSE